MVEEQLVSRNIPLKVLNSLPTTQITRFTTIWQRLVQLWTLQHLNFDLLVQLKIGASNNGLQVSTVVLVFLGWRISIPAFHCIFNIGVSSDGETSG